MTIDQVTNCRTAGSAGLERTRFFPRQLITPDDLTQDQRYFREKARRHNRMLHGWGVVCGLYVRQGKDPCEVIVEPGYALGPYGDEIVVEQDITVDLCHEDPEGNAVSPCGESDIWCSDVRSERTPGEPLYLAIRYAECHARPVRVMPGGCGCDEGDCEYSRIRDSYAIKVLRSLPSSYDPMPDPSAAEVLRCGDVENFRRTCPTCPEEPWVILATIQVGPDGDIGDDRIDNFTLRRYVATFAEYYFTCGEREPNRPGGVIAQPASGLVGMAHSDVLRRVADTAVFEMLDANGVAALERDFASDGAHAVDLPITTLRGVGRTSAIARELGDRTIGEIANTDPDTFVAGLVSASMSEAERADTERRAREIHTRARKLAEVSAAYRR